MIINDIKLMVTKHNPNRCLKKSLGNKLSCHSIELFRKIYGCHLSVTRYLLQVNNLSKP